ncbi:hypothetical protein CVT26_001581 [Gymnopilus dilepis]|uniref:Uncharacterized protein n=1 Tax=Gymnopilus dilepis TaxID=231916 RepID=A0A409WAT8_9AGAR|nr:hypothetical protein CVT26_001581 [Gymnopilus dilepis]
MSTSVGASIQGGGVILTNTGKKDLIVIYSTSSGTDTYTVEKDCDYNLNASANAIDLQVSGKSIGTINYPSQNSISYNKGEQVTGGKFTLTVKTQE